MANKYPSYCGDCRAQVAAGHGELKKIGARWQVSCGGRGHVSRAKESVRHSPVPLNSPGRTALHGRARQDYSLGTETEIHLTWAANERPAESEIGHTIQAGKRAGKYAGQYLTCAGLLAHHVSQDEADDFDLVGPGGSFERHWSVTGYYRPATNEEADACRVRLETGKRAAALADLLRYHQGPCVGTAHGGITDATVAVEVAERVPIRRELVGYSLHQSWRTSAGLLSLTPVYDGDTYYHLRRWSDMTTEEAEMVRTVPEVTTA